MSDVLVIVGALLVVDALVAVVTAGRSVRRLEALALKQDEFFREWSSQSGRVSAALARLEASVAPASPRVVVEPFRFPSSSASASTAPGVAASVAPSPSYVVASGVVGAVDSPPLRVSWADVVAEGERRRSSDGSVSR